MDRMKSAVNKQQNEFFPKCYTGISMISRKTRWVDGT